MLRIFLDFGVANILKLDTVGSFLLAASLRNLGLCADAIFSRYFLTLKLRIVLGYFCGFLLRRRILTGVLPKFDRFILLLAHPSLLILIRHFRLQVCLIFLIGVMLNGEINLFLVKLLLIMSS